jgi:ABC-type antimicrobial peptide transport system permease subunit
MVGATFAAVWIVAGVVLLISVSNAAGLMLMSGIRRDQEMVVRLAIGASSGQLARQLILEGAVLVLLGTVAALVMTQAVMLIGRYLVPTIGTDIGGPNLNVDVWVLGFTLAISAFSTLVASLAPVRHVLGLPDAAVLKTASASPSPRTHRALLALGVVQVACTLAPIATLSVVLTGLDRNVGSIGFDPTNVISLTIDARRLTPQELVSTVQRLEQRLHSGPRSVALATKAPLSGRPAVSSVTVDGDAGRRPLSSAVVSVSPGYFAMLGTPVRTGREFERGDEARGVAIVSRRFVNLLPAQARIVGSVVQIGNGPHLTVVGVAEDIQYGSAVEAGSPVLYTPIRLDALSSVSVLVRSPENPQEVADEFSQELSTATRGAASLTAVGLQERHDRVTAARRRFGQLMGAAALFSTVFSICGLGLVVAYVVQVRLREFAIRRAFGAQSMDIARIVLRKAAVVATSGGVIGALLAVAFLRVLSTAIVGLDDFRVTVLLMPTVTLLLIMLLGALLPLVKAMNSQPADLLRSS